MMHGHRNAWETCKFQMQNMMLRSHAYNVDFIGASPDMEIIPDKAIPTYNNYFIGNDPSKWAGGLPHLPGDYFKECLSQC